MAGVVDRDLPGLAHTRQGQATTRRAQRGARHHNIPTDQRERRARLRFQCAVLHGDLRWCRAEKAESGGWSHRQQRLRLVDGPKHIPIRKVQRICRTDMQ